MATNNAWNNQVGNAFNQIILNAGTNGVAISTDASAATVNVATGGAVKTATFGSTNSTSATTVQSGSGALAITSTNGTWTGNSGTGALGLSTDASATTVSLATGAAVKTVTLGSVTSTSATTVRSGSGALAITSTNGTITMNSGTGTLAIANDATAQTVNISTGAGSKLVTLGTTNGAASLALRYGTADFTMASATGTVMSALDTGEITYPLQPAFLANHNVLQSNITGNGTIATVNFTNEIFDQNSDYDGTNTFTAPIDGRYKLSFSIRMDDINGTVATASWRLSTSNRAYSVAFFNPLPIATAANGAVVMSSSNLCDMDAGDIAFVQAVVTGMAGDTVDIPNSTTQTFFSGYLAC